ncbi:hypothetical protein XENTR_v10022954 [Xenopus tropicalis]|nr:hypothetical protein XENTR_v10022954 [Xenopus tropicalis]
MPLTPIPLHASYPYTPTCFLPLYPYMLLTPTCFLPLYPYMLLTPIPLHANTDYILIQLYSVLIYTILPWRPPVTVPFLLVNVFIL